MISAKIVGDSKNEFGNRITTMVVTFPRYILAELNTHRMFSRNSASSRAIPFKKMLKSVMETPFIPMAWQKDHPGMQGTQYFESEGIVKQLERKWLEGRDAAVKVASELHEGFWELGLLKTDGPFVTKQMCNRLLEPFMYHTVIITASEWGNFFALRCPQYQLHGREEIYRSWKDAVKDYPAASNADLLTRLSLNKGQAEIHMMALAECMWDAYQESTPKQLKVGEWHIPYEQETLKYIPSPLPIREGLSLEEGLTEAKVKVSTVMCARTSYTVVGEDQKPMTYSGMVELHNKMSNQTPFHASPFEHCAPAMSAEEFERYVRGERDNDGEFPVSAYGWNGNFRGFIQYRKMFKNENITL